MALSARRLAQKAAEHRLSISRGSHRLMSSSFNSDSSSSSTSNTINNKAPPVSSALPTNNPLKTSVHIHPLSQVVLMYMQNECHDWISAKGLDRGLTLNRDGTFVLQQLPAQQQPQPQVQERLVQQQQQQQQQQQVQVQVPQVQEGITSPVVATTRNTWMADVARSLASAQQKQQQHHHPRIWTHYDPVEKKHWLSYSLVPVVDPKSPSASSVQETVVQSQHRFLLQDNLMPAWHGNQRKSLSERVHESVQELIKLVDHDMMMHSNHIRHS